MACWERFSETGFLVKVAFIVMFVSMFCNWIAFTTTSWLIQGTTSYWGLWRICDLLSCLITDGTGDIDYGVTQAFGIIGFMCQNVGFLLILAFVFRDSCRGNSEVGMASACLLIFSAIGWLIAVAVFGGTKDDTLGGKFGFSYGLAVVACFLGLIGGILMFLGCGAGGSVGSK